MRYRCFWALFWCMILFLHKTLVYGTTHWLVTEDGRIQGQMDSIYNLQRPYDLMALLKQEQRAVMLENLKQELLAKKNDIDNNDDKDNGLEQKFYRTDPNCIAAGQPLIEFDLYMSTVLPLENKGIRPDDYVDFSVVPHPPFSPPDCTQHVPLDFSMHAFEHLEGMKDRKNLTMSPEVGLKNAISHGDNIDKYGHLLNEALQKNETSWVLYNMAAFYWRIKGSPYQAMECLRRALHYSPRRHKDVALISLGNVLHHARYSNEAAIVVHAALDVSKELNVNHFTLGNIYAVLAEYNRSVICFENTLKIQPDFEAAAKRRHAVLCHSKLETMLESKHRSLQKTLTELREYQQKHELWHQQQQKLISEQARLEEKIEQRLFYDAHRMNSADKEVGELCSMEEKDGRNILQCAWARVRRVLSDYDFTPWGSTDAIVMASEKTDAQDVDYSQPVRPPLYRRNDRSTLPEDQESLPYLSEDWPTKDECDLHVQKFPTWNEFPTTYLSPENKGFDVKTLLGKAQGLQPGEQHPFPWYPPVCSSLSDIPEGVRSYDHLASIKERGKLNPKIADPSMKAALLSSVEGFDGKDAVSETTMPEPVKLDEKIVTDEPIVNRQVTQDEIGQRILTALKQKIGPSWILYNLAGLYWRIVGNNLHGLDCIRRALYFVPDQYRDVPLLNLANVLYKLGRVDDAVTVMKDALTVNGLEPESQFFMGNLLAAVGNLTGAVHHYQMALGQDRLHGAAHSSLRLILCYQKFHRKAQSSVPKDIPPSPCPDGKTAFTSGGDEPHVICTQEKKTDPYYLDRYRERCQLDGLSGQNKAQLCSITPIIVETCGIPSHLPRDHLHCAGSGNKGPLSLDITKMKALSSEHCNGQLFMGPLSDTLGSPSQFTDFNSQLEDITEYYRQKGICSGSDCDRLLFQTAQHHKPHMRLEVIDGILHHRLIFTETPVSPSDCVIYNDGHYSSGCNRDDLKAFINNLAHCEKLQLHDTDSSVNKQSFSFGNSEGSDKASPADQTNFPHSDRDADVPTEMFVPIELPNDYFRTDFFNLLDPTRFISKTLQLPVPNIEECQKQSSRSIDFQELFSTWVSVTTKLKDFSNHIDFSIKPSPSKNIQPLCSASLVDGSTVLRRIRSLQMMNTLKDHYEPESGLTETLQTMGGLSTVSESIPVIGAQLSHALQQNSTSWVINNLAALFWRVNGHVDKALDCILVAYHFSKEDDKAIALLSLTNILQKCGELDDAILVTKMALEKAPSIVAAHFMMANLYAAKGDLDKAKLFYESTLGLQQSFSPARERLHAIQCHQLTNASPERPDDRN